MENNKQPTQRQLRVGEELRHALVSIFERQELRDPVLRGISITVSEVRLGKDLRSAIVFVSPLGGDDAHEVVSALSRASGFLRGAVAKRVQLRYMPTLRFEHDQSFDEATHIDEIFRRPAVARDLTSKGGSGEA